MDLLICIREEEDRHTAVAHHDSRNIIGPLKEKGGFSSKRKTIRRIAISEVLTFNFAVYVD